jgi:ribosomal-protein-alanine N-acetyltransferase
VTDVAPWTLRPMRWWDIDRLRPLEQELFPYDAWPVEAFWAELALGDARVYVVAEDRTGGLVGYAGLSCPARARGADAEVMTVAVDPALHGRGLGRELVRTLQAEAERRGAGRLLLEVRSTNAAALALYERAGFEQIGVRAGYFSGGLDAGSPKVDALVLRLTLPTVATGPAVAAGPDTVPR